MGGRTIGIVATLAIGSALAADLPQRDTGESVSIVQLIANPDRYDGKVIFLSAYAIVRFEGNSLCMVPKAASSKDCVWLELYDGPDETGQDIVRYKRALAKWRPLNGKLVSVRGTFSKTNTDHFGQFSGAIEKISDVYSQSRK